jgi:hypothetical protein
MLPLHRPTANALLKPQIRQYVLTNINYCIKKNYLFVYEPKREARTKKGTTKNWRA